MSNHIVDYAAKDIQIGQTSHRYSKVVVTGDDGTEYCAGNEGGAVLRTKNPWASQEIADNLLEKFSGLIYHSYDASGAFIAPEAQLGDSIEIGGIKSGIFRREIIFDPLMVSNISAPEMEELEHEYEYIPKIQRELNRSIGGAYGSLNVAKKELIAEVDNVKSGLYTIASKDDIEKWKYAQTTLFAQIDDEVSKLSSDLVLEVEKTAELERSLAQLSAKAGESESSLLLLTEKTNNMEKSIASLTARTGTAESSLRLVTQKTSALETASATMSATVDGHTSSIGVMAKKVDGHTSTLAKIEADVIKLQGDTTILGNFTVEGGNIRASKGIVSDSGITGASIYANGTGTQGIISGRRLSCTEIALNGKDYTPQEITSTSSAVLALGIA